MANPFDAMDSAPTPTATVNPFDSVESTSNPFDSLDAAPVEAKKPRSFVSKLSLGARALAKGLASAVVDTAPQAVAGMIQGKDVPLRDESGIDRFIAEQESDARNKALTPEEADTSIMGVNAGTLSEGAKMVGYSAANLIPQAVATMGGRTAGAAVGALTGPAAPVMVPVLGTVGAQVAGATAGYQTGKRADMNQVLRQKRDQLLETNPNMTAEEWDGVKSQIDAEVEKHGTAEGKWEAFGNAAQIAITGLVGKWAKGAPIAKKALAVGGGVAIDAPIEVGSEAMTQIDQANAENAMGMRDKPSGGFVEAVKEVGPVTLVTQALTMGLAGGVNAAVQSVKDTAKDSGASDATADIAADIAKTRAEAAPAPAPEIAPTSPSAPPLTDAEAQAAISDPVIMDNIQRLMDSGIDDQASLDEEVRLMLAKKSEDQTISPPAAEESSSSPDALTDLTPVSDGGQGANSLISPPEPAANINTQSAEVTAGDVSALPSNPIDGEDTGLDMSPPVVNPPVPPTIPLTGKDRIKEKASGDTEILGLPPREQQRKELKANGFSGPAVDQVIEGRKSRAQAIKDKQKARLNPQPTEKASSPVAGNPPAEAHPTTPKVGDIVTLDNGAQYEVTGIREDGSVKRNFIRVKNFTIDYGKTWNDGAKVGDEVPTDEDGDPMPDAFDRTGEVISIDGKKGPGKKLVVQSVSEKGSVLGWIDAPPAPEPMPAVQSPKIEALKKKIRAQREAKNAKYAIGDRVSMADDSRSGTVTGETENGMTMVQWDNAGEGLNPSRAIKRIETTERKAEAPALVPPKSPGAERIKAKLRKPKQPDSNIEEAARRKAEKDAGNSSLLSEAETILKSGRLYPLYKSLLKSAVDKARAGDFSGLASRIEKTKATLATQDAENAVIDKRRDTDVARLIDQYKTVEALTKERDRAQAEMTKASSSKKLGGVSWGKTHDPLSGTRERIEFLNEAINKTASVKVTTEKSGDTTISVPYADKPGLPMKEQKKFLLAEIDKAIEGAKDGDPDEIPHGASVPVFNTVEANNREKFGVVTIDVPGDGEYTLLNSKPVLEKFKKKIGREFPSMLSAQHDTPPRKRGDAYTEKELIDVMSGNPEMIRQYQIQADNGAYNDADTAMVKKAIEKVKGLGIIAPLPPEIAEAKTNALKNVRKNAAEGGLIDTEKKISQDNSNGQAPDTATTGARREENPVSLAKGKDQAPGIRLLSGGFSNDRQERFSAQRESSEKLSESLPAHDLSDYGFPSSGSVMERLRGNKSIEFIAEGNEAIAYRVPEMGIVIKFYPVNSDRTGSAKGYGYVERPGVADGMLTLGEHEWSNSPSDLIEKLKLVDAMGTPTEIVGITKEGVVIVKQADKSIVPNDSIGDGKLESNGVQVFELPGDVAKVPGHALDQSAIIKFDGKWWLASDMHENNRIVDGSGKSHIIDLTLGEIPEAVQNASENSRKFFGLANKRIQDFGEKLGGARKDQVSSVEKEISDDEIANKTLSEIWPKSEVEAIEAPDMAALATALRNEVPAKPRKGYKVARWVETVKLVRSLMKYANEMGYDKLMQRMKSESGVLGRFVDKVNLLSELPREHWDRIGKVENNPDAYRYADAKPGEEGAKKNEYSDKWYKTIPTPHATAEVDGRSVSAKSLEDLPAAVNEKLGVSPATAAMEFEVRGRDGKGYFINKKGDPLYRKLKEFKTSEEALKFRTTNRADLVAAWEAVKESDNVKETDVRRTDNRPRSGSDWRKGSDATPQMFLDTFGFRGVEFGNWVSQGSNTKERQGMLNQAFDALHDLADIIGVPPKALSLNGTLGLGMGSRGHGWASAHYEPGTIVINLTKTRGAGALAHELFHAFDHYFQRQRPGKEVIDKEGSEMITYQPEAYYEHKTTRDRLSATRFNQLTKDVSYSRIKPEDWTRIEGVRPEVEQAFVDLVTALDKSPMAKRSKLIDKGKSGGYWGRVIERAARAFENYVIFKMQQKGYQNDYLANVVKLEEFNRDPERYPYVRDDELAPISEAFDGLFATIKTRETDKGVAMYSKPENNQVSGSMTSESVESAIAPIKAQFPGLTFTVKESGDVAGQQQGRGATLFANRITDADHAKRVALEEAAHAGIRYMTPEQWKGVMNTTFRLRRPEYQRMVGVVKAQYPEYAEGSREFKEEIIAHIAQSGRTNQSLWNRFVAAVRAFFRKQGWLKSLNDNDVDSLINSAFNKVERKAPAFSTTETDGDGTRGTAETMAQDLGVTLTGLPRNSEKTALDRIRLATGWIKAANGKWMYEANDSRLSVNPDGKTLGEAVSHPTLFKLYPEISSLPAGSTDVAVLSRAIRTAIQDTEPSSFSKASNEYTGAMKKIIQHLEYSTPMIEAGVKAGEIKAKRDMTVRGRALVAEDRKKAELQPMKNEPVTIPGIVTAAIKTGREIEREKGRKMSIEYSVDKSFRAQAKDQGVKEMEWLERSAERLKYLNDELKRTPDSDRAKVIMTTMSGILGAERSKAALRAAQFRAGDVLEYVSSALHDRMINRYAKGISKVFEKIVGDGIVPNPNMDKLTDDAKEMAKQWLSEIPSRENGIGTRVATLSGIDYERLQDWWNRWMEIKALDRTDRETIIKDERWNSSKLSEKLVEETEKARKSQIDGAIRPKNLGTTTDIMVDFFANTSLMAQRAFGGLKSLGHSLFSDGLTKAENEYKSQKHKARLALGKELERLGVSFFKKTAMMTDIKDVSAGGQVIRMTDAERMHLAAFVGLMENDKMTGGRVIARHHILRDGFIRESLAGTNSKITGDNMPEIVADIVKTLTPTEKAIVRKIVEIQTGMGKDGNKVSKRLTGRSLFTEDWYMGMRPERISEITADELNTNAGAQKILENSGFTKTVVDHKMPIKIGNIFSAFDEHVDGMSRYIGLTIPLRSIRTAMKANDSALIRSLNERMGTDWNRRMTQTMLKLAGAQNPMHGPIKLLSSLSSNVMRSILAWNPGSYFNNRVPGAIMLAAAISENHPKAAARMLSRLAIPTPIKTNGIRPMTALTKENERIRAYLMEHGLLGDRWDSDYSSIAAPITKDAASQLKGKAQMVLRHISNISLNPMMHAEVRNGIDAFKALKAEGVSDAEARDIVAAATRATQNSSSPLDDSAFIQGVRDFGLGGLFPFLSQSVVARNYLVGNMADKKVKGTAIAVAGLAASLGAMVMFRALVKSMRNGPGDDDDEAKEAALIDSLGNIFDTVLPGSGIITEQFLNTMFGKYQNGGGLIIEQPLSEMAKLAGNVAAGKEADPTKAIRAATQLMGLPTGGLYSVFGIARGIAAD